MLFNSMQYLVFFPVVTLLYFLFPSRHRWLWLLLCSYYFYMSWSATYAGLMLLSTAITYWSGLFIGRASSPGGKKAVVAVSLLSNLGILFFFKYFQFFADLLGGIPWVASAGWESPRFQVLLPVGISFYTFQALSYTMDVYRGQIRPERHFGRYALFVSFFPQLVAGPIERSRNLLVQMRGEKKFSFQRMNTGLILMGIGFFKKVVIADRVAVVVDTVYNAPHYYQGFTYIVATLLFAVQIYCDFSGYSDIAMGSAKVLGFDLMENFRRPYFSKSVAEFWRRWHISLSGWFKDYLYFPLGGNRVSTLRRYGNLMAVFLISGLWHGASLTFVFWGALHGVYQIAGICTRKLRDRLYRALGADTANFGFRFGQCLCTFLLVCFAWIFFRANSLSDAFYMVRNLFHFNFWVLADDSLFTLGLGWKEFAVAMVSIAVLFFIDWFNRGKDIVKELQRQNILFRWGVYLLFLFWILIFGHYGSEYDSASFIYFQF